MGLYKTSTIATSFGLEKAFLRWLFLTTTKFLIFDAFSLDIGYEISVSKSKITYFPFLTEFNCLSYACSLTGFPLTNTNGEFLTLVKYPNL